MKRVWTTMWVAGVWALLLGQAAGRKLTPEVRENRAAADALFDGPAPLHLRLEVADPDYAALKKEPRKYVPARLWEGDRVYTNLSLHLKGSAGSFRAVDDKPALTLKFETEAPRDTFHGLKKFHLNNSVQDPTYLSEWLCNPLFRAAGVPTGRSTHALVDFNGRKLGLYNLVESPNKDFLSLYFTNAQGNLYSQSSNSDVNEPLARMSGKGENTRADLKALATAAWETDRAELATKLPQVLDLERYLSFMAMEVILCHWDGYTFSTHNFRVYQDLDTDKMVFLPHDFDLMLENPKVPIQPGANGRVSSAILRVPELRARYRERFGTLFTNLFVPEQLTQRLDRRVEQLLPALEKYDPTMAGDFRTRAAGLKSRVERRAESLAFQLTQPIPASQFFHGLVLDETTQKPVRQFRIIPGFGDDERTVKWERGQFYAGLRGVFDTDLAATRLPQRPDFFRFEAAGYAPAVVRYQAAGEDEDRVYRITLKKGGPLAGSIRLPGNSGPAIGAHVALARKSSSPTLAAENWLSQPGVDLYRTLDLGRFSFSPDPEARGIVAAHPAGFAEAAAQEVLAKPQVVLQPWGRIEGRVAPSTGTTGIWQAKLTADWLAPRWFPSKTGGRWVLDDTHYTLEARETFLFTNVPPGRRVLWRSVPLSGATERPPEAKEGTPALGWIGQTVTVRSGETARVAWGGQERTLRGRLTCPAPAPSESADVIAIPEAAVRLGCLRVFEGDSAGEPQAEYFFTLDWDESFEVIAPLPARFRAEWRLYEPPRQTGRLAREIEFKEPASRLELGTLELEPVKENPTGTPPP